MCKNLLDSVDVEENIRGGLCNHPEKCYNQMEKVDQDGHYAMCREALSLRPGSQCAIAPFGGCREICDDDHCHRLLGVIQVQQEI